jgi:membrane protein implicated in regulation of membrane protease activity
MVAMNSRTLGLSAALLAVLFVILNFTVEGAGTLFLILAVVAGVAAGYFLSRRP